MISPSCLRTVIFASVVLTAAVRQAEAAVTYNFNAGDSGFTVTSNPFNGPWVYGGSVGTGGSGGWSTDGQGPENSTANTTRLTSPSLTVEANGAVTVGFDHMFSFEGGNWDGGALFMSVNGGAMTMVGSASFTSNGYTGSVLGNSASTLAGQQAFVLDSAGRGTGTFINSAANLGNFTAGDQIQLQFVAAYDTNTQGNFLPAWVIDNVAITGVVPEPATAASLLGTGLLLGLRRRRA